MRTMTRQAGVPIEDRRPVSKSRAAAMGTDQARSFLVAAVLALVTVTCAGDRRDGGSSSELARAVGRYRPFEPRLTGGFAWAPCRPAASGSAGAIPRPRCSDVPPVASRQRRTLLIALETSAEEDIERGSAGLRQRWFIAQLLLQPGPDALDRAVDELSRALEDMPHDPALASDVAAAHLVRAQQRDTPRDLARAVTAAEQAVALDPDLAEARFNLALALEALQLKSEASAEWRAYLELDPRSEWADEVRNRLEHAVGPAARERWSDARLALDRAALSGDAETVERLASRHPQETREWIEGEVLLAWAAARRRSDAAAAARALTIARSVAAPTAEAGDTLASAAVAGIDRAIATGAEDDLEAVGSGLLAIEEGRRVCSKDALSPALARFDEAVVLLTAAGSPLELEARYQLARCLYMADEYRHALAGWDALASDLADRRYPSLAGRTEFGRGLLRAVLGSPPAALPHYRYALELFSRRGEAGHQTRAHLLLAEAHGLLADSAVAWRHLYQGLRRAVDVADPEPRRALYEVAADTALRDGFSRLALRFQAAAIREAWLTGDRQQIAETLTWRGLMRAASDERHAAAADIARARKLARSAAPTLRPALLAGADLVEGTLLADDQPQESTLLLTSALETFAETGHRVMALLALRARARAHRASGATSAAAADLETALSAYEELGRGAHQSGADHLVFLLSGRELVAEMVDLELERGRPTAAFEHADRSRTRILGAAGTARFLDSDQIDQLLAREQAPLPLATIRRRLPPRTILVQYAMLPDRLIIWLIRRDDAVVFEQPVGAPELEGRVRRWRELIEQGSAPDIWSGEASSLFRLLLSPWIATIEPGERLVFVPDGVLHDLPFACLSDPDTGRWLVTDRTFVVAPSASLYVHAEHRGRSAPKSSPSVMVVGDPAFDPVIFPRLSRLPHAGSEARSVSEIWRSSPPLVGAAATKNAVLAAAAGADLVHIAAHAISNRFEPLLSLIALAPEGTESGALTAAEIYRADLSPGALVVLSVCESAGGDLGEQPASLARAFLAAGASTVVASLWRVEDAATARLFKSFHRHLATHADAVEALRQAQLEAIARDEPAALWGAFEAIGYSSPPY